VLSFCSFLSTSKWVFFSFIMFDKVSLFSCTKLSNREGFGLQLYNIWYFHLHNVMHVLF
jgi:hypothetical protein